MCKKDSADNDLLIEIKNSDRMGIHQQVLQVLDEVLSLSGRSASFDRHTHLLGALPELDSMAVVSLLSALEEQLGLSFDDQDLDGAVFANVGSLVDFVAARIP
ncbi:acyl carrier protein [Paucibacter sp. AS339]|uniref:acyl carrier protein n=1 Tax=Paucibacter hankyongi TaxID=3133434 RepID=UPI00309BC890